MRGLLSGFFRRKWVLAAVAAVLVCAAAVMVFLLLPGRSARDFYFSAESKNYKRVSDWIKKSYRDFENEQKPYLSGNYERRTETTLDIKPGSGDLFGISNPGGIFGIAAKCKLIADTKHDPGNGASLTKLSLLLERNPLIDADIFTKDKRMYFTVPVLTPDRWFSLDENRLDEVYDRFGIPVKPKRILNAAAIAGALKLDEKGLDISADNLGAFFSKTIGKGDVKYGRDKVQVDISGKTAEGREVVVSLSAGRSLALMKGLAKRLSSDDMLIGLTYGNLADVSGMAGEAGLYGLLDYLDKAGMVVLGNGEKELLKRLSTGKDVEGFKKAMGSAFDKYSFPQGIDMKLIIDRSGNILVRTLDTVMKDDKRGKAFSIKVHTGATSLLFDDCRNRFADIGVSVDEKAGLNIKLEASFMPYSGTDDEHGTVNMSFSTKAGKDTSSTALSFELDSSTDKATLKKNNTVRYSISMQDSSEKSDGTLNGELSVLSWKNNKLKTRDWNTRLTVNADLPSFGIKGFSGTLALAGEDRLETGSVVLPAAPPERTVDLNTASGEELDRVWNEIRASFGAFYLTNKPIIDAVTGAR